MYIKYIVFIILSLALSNNVKSQIGIRTEFPKGALHIDGAMDNPQNTTSALTPTQEQNDIIVDNSGRIGIGTTTPKNKLHIAHDPVTTGNTYGLRMTPGYGGAAILALQNDGKTVKWEANPSLGQSAQFQVKPERFDYKDEKLVPMTKLSGSLNLSGDNNILVPSEGRYLLTFDMMGAATLSTAIIPPYYMSIYIYLYKYNTLTNTEEEVDAIEHYMPVIKTNDYMAFQSTLYAGYCYPTDYLYVRFCATIAFGTTALWDGYFTTTSATPCIVTIYNI